MLTNLPLLAMTQQSSVPIASWFGLAQRGSVLRRSGKVVAVVLSLLSALSSSDYSLTQRLGRGEASDGP